MFTSRQLQAVGNLAKGRYGWAAGVEQFKLGFHKANIERGVVNNEFRPTNEVEKLVRYSRENGFIRKELFGDAMDFQSALVDSALRLDVLVIVATCELTVDDLNTTDFDNAVPLANFKARCFRI